MGTYPPINVFQQGDDLVAIVELPGINKGELNIQAKENTIGIAGQKTIDYPENVSLHRRERLSGVFDRTSPFRCKSTLTAYRLNITMACWRFSFPGQRRTSREQSR